MTTTMTTERVETQKEALERLERESKAADDQARQTLFRNYANDEPVDFATMKSLRLTVADLEAAKGKILENRRLRAKMDQIGDSQAALPKLKADIAAKVQERETAVNAINDEIRQLEAVYAEHVKTVSEGKEARRLLIANCESPVALKMLSSTDAEMESVNKKIIENQTVRKAKEQALDAYHARAASEDASRITRLTSEVNDLETERRKLDEHFKQLQVQRKKYEDQWSCDPDSI